MSNISIAIGADHGGYDLKTDILPFLNHLGLKVLDLGACTYNSADDYPDFAQTVARNVACGKTDRGIIICGSGVGACITANKIKGIRAGLCHDVYSAHQGVEHDDMNVLCLGARVIGIEVAKEIISAFLNARFTGEERHKRRLEKLLKVEKEG
ncbi:ribose 5-phosphate isomerase B [Dehalococcoides mccartyi]|uniref:ribose 5-phosphate isomerase B n=1 Tax=Dehalococcoides mccartyi TaxID=61435 RepID=UPI0002B76BD7|nr:ribose 5-phosphate isomerase B [Dehalococcoides mccartyi]AGG07706.1 ribose 5-phosphate isomerase B [Dehalococcoides mccartyi BTF08]AQW62270.1 ribose 5-phosphate isomerase B [Dehalococcoides mccartyi]AQX73075.1 ribose 5-phosphate isomerase B [Dehalococcoides mccartyi]KSV16909.1 ribose 5-phosphate isomerase [Dehalococcoides mccartyi]